MKKNKHDDGKKKTGLSLKELDGKINWMRDEMERIERTTRLQIKESESKLLENIVDFRHPKNKPINFQENVELVLSKFDERLQRNEKMIFAMDRYKTDTDEKIQNMQDDVNEWVAGWNKVSLNVVKQNARFRREVTKQIKTFTEKMSKKKGK